MTIFGYCDMIVDIQPATMNQEHTTGDKIMAYLKEKNTASINEMKRFFGISHQALYKHLNKLLSTQKIAKSGRPPKVYYHLAEPTLTAAESINDKPLLQFINDNYLLISSAGNFMPGLSGFAQFCRQNNLPLEKTAREYQTTLQKYNQHKRDGLISGLTKFQNTFPQIFLDEVYYFDFYSIERFGKTKLGTLLLHAKQTQNKELIKMVVALTRARLTRLIEENKIDALGFIPPTVPRQIQFQKEFATILNFSLPQLNLVKTVSDVAVPQKSLSKLSDRVENARRTIFVDDNRKFKNILLIDDAVGSGATLNAVAEKIKNKGLCSGKIIGLALTGSFKGFDVISEV